MNPEKLKKVHNWLKGEMTTQESPKKCLQVGQNKSMQKLIRTSRKVENHFKESYDKQNLEN